ncbi:hypothetical protein WKI13_00715 [Teredinibacter turnerae]|uniref:hypothetical protein n=1 Tax=Teredinibacter turnerae TaxID=2426 RepID=UPI0012F7B182|nr:hypothetical protein [Teredinibacter turnerae]
MKCKVVIGVLILFISSLAIADKYTNNVSISQIEVLANGSFRIWSLENISDSGCYESGRLFKVYVGGNGLSSDGAKNLLSIAMLAYSLGHTVDIYHDEAQNCLVSQIRISK